MRKHSIVLVLLAVLAPLVWFLQFVGGTPGIIVVASMVPAVVVGWLLARLVPASGDSDLLIASFLGGAVLATFVSSSANGYLLSWLTDRTGEAHARLFAPAFGAPVIEELAKALALLAVALVWRSPTHAVEGATCGGLVGIGFAMTENLSYLTLAMVQGGLPGLAQGVYLRSLIGSAVHATFTAATGAGLGYGYRSPSTATRVVAAAAGLAFAIAQHLGWNAVAAGTIRELLCAPAVVGGVCSPMTPTRLFVTLPGIVVAAIGPGIAALILLSRRAPRPS